MVLDKAEIDMKNRPVKWTIKPENSNFWSIFTKDETKRFSQEKIAMHAHDWAISMKTFS